MLLNLVDRPTWFETAVMASTQAKGKKRKKRKTSSSKGQSTLDNILHKKDMPLTIKEKKAFDEKIALHYYLTGSAFQRVEEESFLSAVRMLNPFITLPNRRRLAGTLLTTVYDAWMLVALAWFVGKIVCLASDAWTNTNQLPVVNYMAINSEKSLFVECVDKDVKHDAQWLADDSSRVIKKLLGDRAEVAGGINDNTAANQKMWKLLKIEFPSMFFYGCIAHGLHLLIRDIFGPSKTLKNNPDYRDGPGNADHNRGLTKMHPQGYPFADLLGFIEQCRELVSFFKNTHYPRVQLLELQRENRVSGLQAEAATRWGTLEKMAESIIKNDANITAVVQGRGFVSDATTPAGKATRRALKTLVEDPAFITKLTKIVAVCAPINRLIVKYQSDKHPLSAVYRDMVYELPAQYDLVTQLDTAEREYVVKRITKRWEFLAADCHGMAYVLDPKWAGADLAMPKMSAIESNIFKWTPSPITDPELRDDYEHEVEAEYMKYIIFARTLSTATPILHARLTREKSPLAPYEFWTAYGDQWPKLKKLALRIFSLPASTASCERNFSLMGFIHSKIRNKLGAAKVQMITFIKNNYHQLKGVKQQLDAAAYDDEEGVVGEVIDLADEAEDDDEASYESGEPVDEMDDIDGNDE